MTLLGHSDYEQLPPPGTEQADTRTAAELPAGELAARLSDQVVRLARAEFTLAQAEIKGHGRRIGIAVGMFGAGGMFAFFGACCGVVAAIIGLSNVVQPWLSAIIVGAALFVLALIVVLPGWKGISGRHPVPYDAIASVRADIAAVREALRR